MTAVEFRADVRGGEFRGEQRLSIEAPVVYAGVAGIADRIRDVEIRDPSGKVPLTVGQDPPGQNAGYPYFRHWRAARDVASPVTISYRSGPEPGPFVMGPQFGFRAHDGGLSTAGSGFLAVPWGRGPATIRVKWDLSDLPPGSTAAATLGDGDFEVTGPTELLTQSFYMAGPLGRYVPEKGPVTFAGYWLGAPQFDPREIMAWTSEAYAFEQKTFRDERPKYRMFMRALPGVGKGSGGTALGPSFMVAVGTSEGGPPAGGPKQIIAHEMMHMFTGGIQGNHKGAWYDEGLADYYTQLILLRSGLRSVDDYLESVNASVATYYASPYRNASAEEITRLGFGGGVGKESPQKLPYVRGQLYFAMVDAKIRAASVGKRKLDDVLLPLLEKRNRGKPFTVPVMVSAFEKEYGPGAQTDFRSVNVLGGMVELPSEAFGIGFERRAKKFQASGKVVDGYEWVRRPLVTDERCREW